MPQSIIMGIFVPTFNYVYKNNLPGIVLYARSIVYIERASVCSSFINDISVSLGTKLVFSHVIAVPGFLLYRC
jgi:hypothetical protein